MSRMHNQNDGESDREEDMCLDRSFSPFLGSSVFGFLCRSARAKNPNLSKRVRCPRKTCSAARNPIWWGERMTEAGEKGDCERMTVVEWGRGLHPTCMNSRIRVGIVQRAKSRCVPFPGVTSHTVHGRSFFYFNISYILWGRGRDSCRLCLQKYKTHIQWSHDRNICFVGEDARYKNAKNRSESESEKGLLPQ